MGRSEGRGGRDGRACVAPIFSLACAEFANNTASFIEAQFNIYLLLIRYLIGEGSLSLMIIEITEMCAKQIFFWAIRA